MSTPNQTLFTYCIPYDDGAAPNPFWGTCTLVICKPGIRRAAKKGDWVVGTGSVNSPVGNTAGRVVYAMRITEKMPIPAYDNWCRKKLPGKIPDLTARDVRRHVGDAIYDFSTFAGTLRPSVHTEANRKTDLDGRYALLSDDFYYFGKNAVPLPEDLLPIVKQAQGHRSGANASYLQRFVEWIRTQTPGLQGDPQMWVEGVPPPPECGGCRIEDDPEDDGRGGC
jgi:hypothetical protein